MLRDEPTRQLQREHKLAKQEIRQVGRDSIRYPHYLAFIRNLEGELKARQARFTPFEEES